MHSAVLNGSDNNLRPGLILRIEFSAKNCSRVPEFRQRFQILTLQRLSEFCEPRFGLLNRVDAMFRVIAQDGCPDSRRSCCDSSRISEASAG